MWRLWLPLNVVSTEQELCLRGVGPWNAWWHQPPVRFSSRSSASAWASFFMWELHPNIYKKSWKILGPPKKLTVGHQKSDSSKENALPIVKFQVPCSTFGAYSFLHRVEFWMSIWILLQDMNLAKPQSKHGREALIVCFFCWCLTDSTIVNHQFSSAIW